LDPDISQTFVKIYITVRNFAFPVKLQHGIFSSLRQSLRSRVADPGCFSQIPDPDFYPSRISHPASKKLATKERGERKKLVVHLFVATNMKKLKIIIFELVKEKI
jgi:hypothetical protein